MIDYNKLAEYFVFDLVSAVDYVGDIKAYLYKCETEFLPCDIQYLKSKVEDVMFDLNSIMDRLCNGGDDKNTKLDKLK